MSSILTRNLKRKGPCCKIFLIFLRLTEARNSQGLFYFRDVGKSGFSPSLWRRDSISSNLVIPTYGGISSVAEYLLVTQETRVRFPYTTLIAGSYKGITLEFGSRYKGSNPLPVTFFLKFQ